MDARLKRKVRWGVGWSRVVVWRSLLSRDRSKEERRALGEGERENEKLRRRTCLCKLSAPWGTGPRKTRHSPRISIFSAPSSTRRRVHPGLPSAQRAATLRKTEIDPNRRGAPSKTRPFHPKPSWENVFVLVPSTARPALFRTPDPLLSPSLSRSWSLARTRTSDGTTVVAFALVSCSQLPRLSAGLHDASVLDLGVLELVREHTWRALVDGEQLEAEYGSSGVLLDAPG